MNPANPLQDEVGGSVASPDAGANEADSADREKVRAGPPLLAFRFDEGDTDHPVIVQRPREHLAKARLKDVEGKQRVGEKQDARKRHDGDNVGKFNGFGHRRAWFYSLYARWARRNWLREGWPATFAWPIEA